MKIKKFIADHKVEIASSIFAATVSVVGLALLNKTHENALRRILTSNTLLMRIDEHVLAEDIISAMKELKN